MTTDRTVTDLELASSLNAMAESTTAAELVRQKGQTKKVKVLSERKLMEWILALLKQHLASKEDSFTDAEKEELLRRTQEELARRIQREQNAEAARAKAQDELDRVLAEVAHAQSAGKDMSGAVEALRAKLNEAEGRAADLQQDSYELQDQLQEKLSLLSTTIAEKDKLRDTVRRQMIRSGGLTEGVLGLDSAYYGGRHADENPVADDASDDERFFHDFDIGAKIIDSLSADLEKLRSITAKGPSTGGDRLLENDLAMLAQLKSGSLHAVDVAAPVAALIEALDGARTEAESFQGAISRATGSTRNNQALSLLPDSDGDPAEVLAGAATVARELAAELARSCSKVEALKTIAEEADQARNAAEEELEALKSQESRDELAFEETHAAPTLVQETLAAQVQITQRILGESTPSVEDASAKALAERLRLAGSKLEALVQQQRQQLTAAAERERALGEQIQALARLHARADAAKTGSLEHDLDTLDGLLADSNAAPAEVTQAATAVITDLARKPISRTPPPLSTTAKKILSAASEDPSLADLAADLAIALDQPDEDLVPPIEAAIEALLDDRRHHAEELQQVQGELTSARTHTAAAQQALTSAKSEVEEARATTSLLQDELEANSRDLVQAATTITELRNAAASVMADQEEKEQRIRQRSDRLRVSLGSVQRSLIGSLSQMSVDDDDLRSTLGELQLALERLGEGEPLPEDHAPLLEKALQRAVERQRELQIERDEMAASGKEIISTLSSRSERHETELKTLRQQCATQRSLLTDLEHRSAEAGAASRRLGEALAAMAAAAEEAHLPGEGDDHRVDLELALSQLPAEGELGIAVPRDVHEQLGTHGEKVARTLQQRQRQAAEALRTAQAQASLAAGRSEQLETDLRLAQASLDELHARGGAGAADRAQELDQVRTELTSIREALALARQENRSLQEQAEAAEARVKRQREELTKRLEERDRIIADKDARLDAIADGHVENASSQAEIEALQEQLTKANARIAELESLTGNVASVTVRQTNQALELRRAHGERDALREEKRSLEAELSDANARIEELENSMQERAKELLDARRQAEQQVLAEREKTRVLAQELQTLRQDVAGLQARLRRLDS